MKTDLLYKEKERKSSFTWLIIILLIATNFLGLEPFETYNPIKMFDIIAFCHKNQQAKE